MWWWQHNNSIIKNLWGWSKLPLLQKRSIYTIRNSSDKVYHAIFGKTEHELILTGIVINLGKIYGTFISTTSTDPTWKPKAFKNVRIGEQIPEEQRTHIPDKYRETYEAYDWLRLEGYWQNGEDGTLAHDDLGAASNGKGLQYASKQEVCLPLDPLSTHVILNKDSYLTEAQKNLIIEKYQERCKLNNLRNVYFNDGLCKKLGYEDATVYPIKALIKDSDLVELSRNFKDPEYLTKFFISRFLIDPKVYDKEIKIHSNFYSFNYYNISKDNLPKDPPTSIE
jgi:hypothetical protein